jgi:sirohydrochlorin ferrochelatase
MVVPGGPIDSNTSSERTAVLLIAHGSREPSANDDLHALADRLSASGEHPIVVACFLELAEPDIPTGGERCVARGARRVLMVPYFLSAGVHLRRDLTAARDQLQARHPGVEFRLGPPLGPHPLLDSLVTARIRELEGTDSGSRGQPIGCGSGLSGLDASRSA